MKPFVALAVAALLMPATAADAKGFRIRLSAPRLSVAPTISPVKAVTPAPARPQRSGGLIILPGVGASQSASARTTSSQPLLDTKPDASQDWSATPFAARTQSAATLPAWQPPQPAPKAERAAFQCPPERNVGGFCVLN